MKTLTIFLALLLTVAFPLHGHADEINKDLVTALIHKSDQAIAKKDAAAVAELISDTAKISIARNTPNGAKVTKLSKAEYLSLMKQTWALASNYNYRRKNLNISIEGSKAIVTDDLAESMAIHGQYVSGTSSETTTIELVNGKPLITHMEAEVSK